MIISKEEKQINRPLLYFTGGLVLGETMALWMTAETELFWLAVMLSVLCGAWKYGIFSHAKRNSGMLPAFFALLFLGGALSGVGRMEYEQSVFRKEKEEIEAQSGDMLFLSGEIREITKSQSGYRLLLKKCVLGEEPEETADRKIRNVFCYVESAENLKIGMRIRVCGELEAPDPARNPGSFHYQHYCYAKGIGGIFYADQAEIVDGSWLVVSEWARVTRLLLEERIERIAEGEDIGILKAILLGNKSELDEEVYETYRKNGISHVLAISGLHVSVIGMGIWKMLRRSGMSYTLSGVLAFLMLFFYGLVAGFGTSVARAVFMMGLSFAAGSLGRTYDLPSAMCVPAVGLLLCYPYLLTQASFQLSFLAVGAIFFPGDYLSKRWELNGIAKNIFVSASIQLMTAPAVLYHSFEIPLYSILLNLVVIPLMTYVLVSGLLGTAVSFFSIPAGKIALGGAHYILWFYRWLCERAERIPYGSFAPGRPCAAAIGGFYVCLVLGVMILGRKKKWGAAFFAVAVLFLIRMPPEGLTITFLDVGQGDGIVLQSESGAVLVDCGSSQKKDVGEDVLVPFLKCRGIRELSAVVVSHGDSDHVNGIRYLLREENGIGVGALIMPEVFGQDETLADLAKLAERKGIEVLKVSAGEWLREYLGGEIRMRCLHPSADDVEGSFERNEDSLVLELVYDDFRLLLTGDLDQNGEEAILRRETLSKVTVLKAGHHGSASSSGEAFLESLQPSSVVFSYGRENRYGHPSDEVIERCRSLGADIYETGRKGAVEIRTDGEHMRIYGLLDRYPGI